MFSIRVIVDSVFHYLPLERVRPSPVAQGLLARGANYIAGRELNKRRAAGAGRDGRADRPFPCLGVRIYFREKDEIDDCPF